MLHHRILRTSSTTRSTRSNLWTFALFCLASAARGSESEEEEAQCSSDGMGTNDVQIRPCHIWYDTVFFSMAYSLHMARRALNKLRGDVQQQIDEVIGPVIYQVMAREYHDSIHREGLDWIFQEEKLPKYRGDLTTLSRAVHRASLQLDEPHQQGRRLQDNRPPTSGLNLTKNTET